VIVLECDDVEKITTVLGAIQKTLIDFGGNIGGFNLMNALRVLTMKASCPEPFKKDGNSIPEEVLKNIFREQNLKAWVGIGNLLCHPLIYKGLKKAILEKFKHMDVNIKILKSTELSAIEKIFQYLPFKNLYSKIAQLNSALPILFGTPQLTAMPLTRWRSEIAFSQTTLNPDCDDVGLLWYAPLIPWTEEYIEKSLLMLKTVCEKENIDCPITFTCLTPRCIEATIPILFNRKNPLQMTRAHASYERLFLEGQKIGILPYRLGTVGMDLFNSHLTPHLNFVRILKKTLDPNAILSPGRYL
jgi:4-cresol dehydrogenase (hydroxylating)